MRPTLTLSLTIVSILALACPAKASVTFYKFPIPPEVQEQVQFWHSIFSKHASFQSVIHDRDLPNIVIDVIDFDKFSKYYNDSVPYSPSEQKRIRKKYLDRYQLAIQRFKQKGKKAVKYGPMEERILKVYSQHNEGLSHLFTKHVRLRTQRGLSDEFERAAERSTQYLPYMEKIFRAHSIPVDLTRLPFVESMFNEKAVSKVGASGIWQFMPATARQFMRVDRMVDERNSPIKASYAAAKFMKSNYSSLQSWPLAITAYNHGSAGMRRAVRRLKTKDLGKIIRHYRHRSFGFASKNFYAEFLAANIVYKQKYKSNFKNPNPLNIAKIKLERRTSIADLIRHTPLDEKIIKKYNFCLKENAFFRYKRKPLPRNFEIIIPRYLEKKVQLSMRKLAQRDTKKRYRL